MGYLFFNFWGCLLIAAIIGGLIGWLLRGFGFNSRLADFEAEWGNKLGLAESERETLAARLKEADTAVAGWKSKFASLEADHGKLQADFSMGSGRIPALEAAVAAWTAKGASWETERSRFAADLDACGRSRGILEAQIAEWSTRAKAWDTERSQMFAKLKAAAEEDAVEDANYQKTIDHLRAEVTALQGKLTAAEKANRDWEGKVASVSADLRKAIDSDVTDDAEFQGKIDHLGAEIGGLQSKLATAESAAKDWAARNAEIMAEAKTLREKLSASEEAVKDWEEKHAAVTIQLHKAREADAADDSQFQKAIDLLRGDVATLQTKLSATESYGRQWEGKHAVAAASLAAAELASRDWQSKYAALESEHASLKGELVKFTQDDAFEDADFRRAIQNLRGKVEAMEAQLAGLQRERDAVAAERDRLRAELKTAVAEDAVEDTKYQQTIAQLRGELAALHGKGASTDSEVSRLRAELKAANADRDRLSLDVAQVARQRETAEVLRSEQTNLHQRVLAAEQATKDWATRYSALEAKAVALEAKAAAPIAMAAAAGAGAGSQASVSIASDPNFHALARRFESFLVKTQREGFGDIERIEGIGPVYGQKLRSVGIAWVRELLEQGGTASGRERISEDSGIKRDLILKWVNAADLLRIDGVTPDWAELLEESGVDTVKELRGRVPENLHRKLVETNDQGKYARATPELETVRRWVEQAKRMDPKVSH